MNSGFNPALSTPSLTAKKQNATNTTPFYLGGSQVPVGLGYTPTIPEVKPKPIAFKKK